jgi:hypothetical protein
MNLTATFKYLLKRKLATVVLISASVVTFAALGDDGGKKNLKSPSVADKLGSKTFSLRSNYNYRGDNLLTFRQSSRFIVLNTVVTYQKGNATYILPLKKKVLLDKVVFNPSQLKY